MFPRLLALLVIGSVGAISVIGSTPNFLSSGAEQCPSQCLNSPPVCHTLQQMENNLRFDNGVSAIIRNKRDELESMIDKNPLFSENLPRDAALAVKNMVDASTTAAEREQAAQRFFVTGVPEALGATPADFGSDWNGDTLAKTLGVNERTGFEGALRALGSKNSEQGKEVTRALVAFLVFGHNCDDVADVVFDELLRSQKDHSSSSIIIARGPSASEDNPDASYRYLVGGERERQTPLGKFLLSDDKPAGLVEKLESRKVPYVVRVGLSLGSSGMESHHFVLVRDFVEAGGGHYGGNGGYIVHAGGFASESGGPLVFALGADFGLNALLEEEVKDLIGKLLGVNGKVKRGEEAFWGKVLRRSEEWYEVVDLVAAPISGFGEMGGAGK